MWFERITGFKEETPCQVRKNIKIVGNKLVSKINNNEFVFGKLEVPSLQELRGQSNPLSKYNSNIKVEEVIGDIQTFHKESANNNSVIQVASQFNLLEMVNPYRTPEAGVGIYEYDLTQGPACAVACGAGTIYRNYFANVDGQIGQTSSKQIDCLKDIGIEFENMKYNHWEMTNGYALANSEGLKSISQQIRSKTRDEYEYLKGKLRIGIQWNAEVTISSNSNFISQVYCSALPIAYSDIDAEQWADFACMVLEATYEATFYAALKNYEKTGNNELFLTLIGGGAFGNKDEWIFSAIAKSIEKFSNTSLNIKIVSYGESKLKVRQFIKSLESK